MDLKFSDKLLLMLISGAGVGNFRHMPLEQLSKSCCLTCHALAQGRWGILKVTLLLLQVLLQNARQQDSAGTTSAATGVSEGAVAPHAAAQAAAAAPPKSGLFGPDPDLRFYHQVRFCRLCV